MLLTLSLGFGLGLANWQGVPASEVVVSAPSAIVVDADTGLVLFEKKPDVRRHPASTTKIMTALLLIEKSRPEEIVTAPKDIRRVRESSAHLMPSEKISMRDLLHAVMLRSANDACVAGAVHVSGNEKSFVALMNQRAKQLGLTQTRFENPHGLTHPRHLTTARDLATLARAAIVYPEFNELTAKPEFVLTRDQNQLDTVIANRNDLLGIDPTIDGIKTGWTRAAGKCFVGSATRNGKRLISVILKSEAWRHDTLNLLDWAFDNWQSEAIVKSGEELARRRLPEASTELVAVAARGVDGHANLEVKRKIHWKKLPELPISAGASVGTLTLTDGRGYVQRVDLVAQTEVRPVVTRNYAGMIAVGLGLVGGYVLLRYRRQQVHAEIVKAHS